MKLLFSSIGKKIQVALSGLFLSIFLFFHLMNNLVLIIGPEEFNNMVYFLESIKPIIRVMEVGLVIIILLHVVNTLFLLCFIRPLQFSIFVSKPLIHLYN